jgi:DNA-binding CsgD family transcriptional regulator
MPLKNATDDEILKLIKAGKTYTDIIVICRCSPSRISVIKKRFQLKKKRKKLVL